MQWPSRTSGARKPSSARFCTGVRPGQTHRLVELEQLLAEMHGDADAETIGLGSRPPPQLWRREIELVRVEDAAIAAVECAVMVLDETDRAFQSVEAHRFVALHDEAAIVLDEIFARRKGR